MNLLLSWATAARARFQRAPSPDTTHTPGQTIESKGNEDLQNGNGGGRSFAPATSPPAPDSEILRTRARLMPGVVLPPAVDCLNFCSEKVTVRRVLPERFMGAPMYEVDLGPNAWHDDGSVLTTIVLPVIIDDGEGAADKATSDLLPGIVGYGAGPKKAAENLFIEIKALTTPPHRFVEMRPAVVSEPMTGDEVFNLLTERLHPMQPDKEGWALSSAGFVCSLLDGLDIRRRSD